MFHLTEAGVLGNYVVVEMVRAEGAGDIGSRGGIDGRPLEGPQSPCEGVRPRSSCDTQWQCGELSFGWFGAWLLMLGKRWGTRWELHVLLLN